MVVITDAFITQGMTDRGAWYRYQLELLGVQWPPLKGWKQRVIGNLISDEDAALFLKRDMSLAHKSTRKKIRREVSTITTGEFYIEKEDDGITPWHEPLPLEPDEPHFRSI